MSTLGVQYIAYILVTVYDSKEIVKIHRKLFSIFIILNTTHFTLYLHVVLSVSLMYMYMYVYM